MRKVLHGTKVFLLIIIGSLLYSLAIHFFIFPCGINLGGTSSVSVILNHLLPQLSAGEILTLINLLLMVVAFVLLGKTVALRTMLGSAMTTLFIGLLDRLIPVQNLLIPNKIPAALMGSMVVAVGSAFLFCIDSSSGGTDIIALIIRKYVKVNIGRALLIADCLIVLSGTFFADLPTAAASVIGLLIKTFGIDLLIKYILKYKDRLNSLK